jgi:hypothetical protein
MQALRLRLLLLPLPLTLPLLLLTQQLARLRLLLTQQLVLPGPAASSRWVLFAVFRPFPDAAAAAAAARATFLKSDFGVETDCRE